MKNIQLFERIKLHVTVPKKKMQPFKKIFTRSKRCLISVREKTHGKGNIHSTAIERGSGFDFTVDLFLSSFADGNCL